MLPLDIEVSDLTNPIETGLFVAPTWSREALDSDGGTAVAAAVNPDNNRPELSIRSLSAYADPVHLENANDPSVFAAINWVSVAVPSACSFNWAHYVLAPLTLIVSVAPDLTTPTTSTEHDF